MLSGRPLYTAPDRSQPIIFFTPYDKSIFTQATPEAPTPATTTFNSSKFFWTNFAALIKAALTTTAVPC